MRRSVVPVAVDLDDEPLSAEQEVDPEGADRDVSGA
jgi:hypothetical protein